MNVITERIAISFWKSSGLLLSLIKLISGIIRIVESMFFAVVSIKR